MPSALPLGALARRLPAVLAVACLALVAAPAHAQTSSSAGQALAGAGAGAGADPARGLAGLGQQADREERRLAAAEAAYRDALDVRARLTEHAVALHRQSEIAGRRAARLREQVAAEPLGGLVDTVSSLVTGDESTVDEAVDAAENVQHALSLVRLAERAVRDADGTVLHAQRALGRARAAAARVEAEQDAARTARAMLSRARFGTTYHVADHQQDALNRDALDRWQHYLTRLGRAGVVPPSARDLRDPAALAPAFEPVRDRRGHPVPGVARIEHRGRELVVLPAETIRAVSETFHLLGRSTGVPRMPVDLACGGLVADAWQPTSYPVSDSAVSQWRDLARVPAGQRQVGDLLFLDGDESAPDLAGVYLGDGQMIAADPSGVAAVRRVDEASDAVLGTRRVPLPPTTPAPSTASIKVSCDSAPTTPVVAATAPRAAGDWTWPVTPGNYVLSKGFGSAGALWSSGQHAGQDFAAPVGTPVLAARAGVVTVEHPSWAGNLVRIDHGDGVETWYAHLSRVDVSPGQQVSAGSMVGAVGDEGNSTGPHLHFEVRIDGLAVAPMTLLSPSS